MSGSSLSSPDVWLLFVDSAPAGISLGRWFLSCLLWMALAASCIDVAAPPLSYLGLAVSVGLSDGDSSAVLKSLESEPESWMYWLNSPAGWRCSLSSVNLVGLVLANGDVDGRLVCLFASLAGDLLRRCGCSSAEDMCPSSLVWFRRLESNCS